MSLEILISRINKANLTQEEVEQYQRYEEIYSAIDTNVKYKKSVDAYESTEAYVLDKLNDSIVNFRAGNKDSAIAKACETEEELIASYVSTVNNEYDNCLELIDTLDDVLVSMSKWIPELYVAREGVQLDIIAKFKDQEELHAEVCSLYSKGYDTPELVKGKAYLLPKEAIKYLYLASCKYTKELVPSSIMEPADKKFHDWMAVANTLDRISKEQDFDAYTLVYHVV